jgi:hypothetical protein
VKRGDFLLSWQFLPALAVLLVNDFVLKRSFPSPVTGFASDAAGVVFFPIAAIALLEFLAWLLPARPFARPWWFIAATGVVGAGFAVVKLTAWGEAFYEALVTPLDAVMGTGIGVDGVGLVRDPVDLFALLLTPVPIWVGWTWRGRRTQPQDRGGPDGLDAGSTR